MEKAFLLDGHLVANFVITTNCGIYEGVGWWGVLITGRQLPIPDIENGEFILLAKTFPYQHSLFYFASVVTNEKKKLN